ncbi:MAG: 30S ribosomal protein S8 [Deltaproteobacteria bacterium]|nr:30S ribosomal protein S8 [Deltaproteobacteria bacterium]
MSMTDPIADFLTRIRNGIKARKSTVSMPSSKMKVHLSEVLKKEGYINNFSVTEDNVFKTLTVELKYDSENQSAIEGLKRISKPGQRIYAKRDNIPQVRYGLGISIITTSRGVMTDKEAIKNNVGGEVICAIW